ncbi:MAG: hypothetical protein V4649_18510 [Bacteroidota bacterium]
MKLYSRKFKDMEDLQRERRKLLKKKKLQDKEPVLSLTGLLPSKSDDDDKGEKGGLLNYLPLAMPIIKVVSGIIKGKVEKKGAVAGIASMVGGRAKNPNLLWVIGKEVAGSYLKWKVLEFAYRGARGIIAKKKLQRAATRPPRMPY